MMFQFGTFLLMLLRMQDGLKIISKTFKLLKEQMEDANYKHL